MISSTVKMPNRIGSHAPSRSFSRFAARNVASMKMSGTISSAAFHQSHFHSRQITMKPRSPSTTIVVVTATP